jgi:hypothetical protein
VIECLTFQIAQQYGEAVTTQYRSFSPCLRRYAKYAILVLVYLLRFPKQIPSMVRMTALEIPPFSNRLCRLPTQVLVSQIVGRLEQYIKEKATEGSEAF